jgi:regulator of replication initiation timing
MESFFTPLNCFFIGLGLGAIFLVLALYNHWKTKREFRRYKHHLSDKLELDAKQLSELKKHIDKLSGDNERLRVQVTRLNDREDNARQRDLEVFARAEKQMIVNAPGFAAAWELAKSSALSQIESEERGESLPVRIFRKLVSSGGQGTANALPAEATAKTDANATAKSA